MRRRFRPFTIRFQKGLAGLTGAVGVVFFFFGLVESLVLLMCLVDPPPKNWFIFIGFFPVVQ